MLCLVHSCMQESGDRSSNVGKVRVLMFFKTRRREGEARGHDMHSTMKILLNSLKLVTFGIEVLELLSCPILCTSFH